MNPSTKRIVWYMRKVVECGDRKRWKGRCDQQIRRGKRLLAYKKKLNELLLEEKAKFKY